jgi:magnesium transporter
VRERLRAGHGTIRQRGPDYIAYAILDTLVDRYYPVAESLSERLDELEDPAMDADDPETLNRIHVIRRQVAVLRRVGWPQREAVGQMARERLPFVSDEVRTFLRDTEDHIRQVMELLDSLREISMGLTEIFLTNVSHRTNEIMKVLTLMASIFIPLTFIAGIYGMNFEYMPELDDRIAYPLVLGVMVLVAVAMIAFFLRQGWIGRSRRRRHRQD